VAAATVPTYRRWEAMPMSGEVDGTGHPLVKPATGFWRLGTVDGGKRAWLIGPDGRASFLIAINTVMRDTREAGTPRCVGIGDYIRRVAPSRAAHIEWARLSSGESGGEVVSRPYGFNSVGAFSETNDFDDDDGDSYMIRAPEAGGAGAPYAVVLDVAPPDDSHFALHDEHDEELASGFARRRIGDPFNPAFLAHLDAMVAQKVVPRRDDPRLQMWFAGNEIGLFDIAGHHGPGVRDLRRWIWSAVPADSSIDEPRCARHALAAFLRDRYAGSIAALNAAWASSYGDFATIVDKGPRPVPYVHDCNGRCGEDLQRFVHDRLLAEWVRVITVRIRGADPNHLVASPRLAVQSQDKYRFFSGRHEPSPDHWADAPTQEIGSDSATVRYSPFDLLGRDGHAGFDLVAINAYTGRPTFPQAWFSGGLAKIHEQSGLPILISEFGVRQRIDTWSNRGGAGAFVGGQSQRGPTYSSQMAQFVSFPYVVGAAWHAWSDRYIPTDAKQQINIGLVQCDAPQMQAGSRWKDIDAEVATTNGTIMQQIANKGL
jgi:hypothetical protein